MSDFDGFTPAAQRFFRSLARHNDKTWFEANRAIYETALREPMKALVEAIDLRLAGFAPEIIGDPRRSMFRINRDIRFSKDKSPYKTNAGLWFYHQAAGRGVGQEAEGGAGFYFHLDGSSSFAGGGIWMPSRPALTKIRDAIATRPTAFRRIIDAPAFRRRFGPLHDEAKLTRVPRGYSPEHPAADLLRHQSFTVGRDVSAAELASAKLVNRLARDFETALPLIRWLNAAIGYPPARQRLP